MPINISAVFLTAFLFHRGTLILAAPVDVSDATDVDIPSDLSDNPEIDTDNFEGDMLSISFVPESETELNTALSDPERKWPYGVVPYFVAENYSPAETVKINNAFNFYHDNTCILFVPLCNRSDIARSFGCNSSDFIHIQSPDGSHACSSHVGRQGTGAQRVTLSKGLSPKGCFQPEKTGRLQHELLHALGFVHEQSRTDRDDFITIVMDNIVPAYKGNFQKYSPPEISSFGEPYDYDSVMHYPPNGFGIDQRKPTIVAKNNHKIGQRDELSPADIRKINKMYEEDCKKRDMAISGKRKEVPINIQFVGDN